MGGRGAGGGTTATKAASTTQKAPRARKAATGASGGAGGASDGTADGGKPTINATAMSDSEFMSRYNAQNPTQAQKGAAYDYTSPNATATGYSLSQNMNYKLDTGQRLTAKEQRCLTGMEQMAKPLGRDTTLYRGAHQNVLEALGVSNYDQLSQGQLKKALVGREWTSKSLTSTSYSKSKSPFLSGPLAGGREVVMNIKASKKAKATMVNPSQAEVVLGRGTNFRVTNVRYTGARAYPRASSNWNGYPVVELTVEAW